MSLKRTAVAIVPFVLLVLVAPACSVAQEESVNPEINKRFKKPDVPYFVKRFEREGREVYDGREKILAACGPITELLTTSMSVNSPDIDNATP